LHISHATRQSLNSRRLR